MEKQFDEKLFFAGILQLKRILRIVNSDNTAKTFLETVLFHCGLDKEDMYAYFYFNFRNHRPDLTCKILDVEGWKEIYRDCLPMCGGVYADIISMGLEVFDKVETFEKFFELVSKALGIDESVTVGEYLIQRIGWLKILNSLVRKAETCESESKTKVSVKGIKKGKVKTSGEISVKTDETIAEPVTSDSIMKEDTTTSVEEESEHASTKSVECCGQEESITGTKGKRRYNVPIVRFTLEGVKVEEEPFKNSMDAERKTKVNHSNIIACLKGRAKGAGGYVWKYLSDVKQEDYDHSITSPSSLATTTLQKKKLEKTEKERRTLIAYKFNGNEVDETNPIGEFKNQQEVADYFGFKSRSMVFKLLSPKYPNDRLKWFTDEKRSLYEWITLRWKKESA